MPREVIVPLVPAPGVVKSDSPYAANGRFIDADKIRWSNGFAEKIDGWVRHSLEPFVGKCRSLHAWRSDVGNRYLAIGTHKNLYVLSDKTLYDITPLRSSGTLTDPFATTDGSSTVVVTDVSHGASEGDYVHFDGATAVGGLTIDGEYEVLRRINADSYEIEAADPATSTATGGGSVAYEYDISVGLEYPGHGAGWGTGTWGTGTWGTPRVGTNYRDARIWHLDNWGPLLIACPTGGDIYEWDPTTPTVRAVRVSNSPQNNVSMFITAEKHIVAVGADADPMKLMWSDLDDRTNWTPATDSDAGFMPVAGGNRLVAGMRFREGVNLIWTDTHLFLMQYTHSSSLFILAKAGIGCGLVGAKAMAEYAGVIYWMAPSGFYAFDGQLRSLSPNDIHDFVQHNLSRATQSIVVAGASVEHSEVWFWYPVTEEGQEISRYVSLEVAEGGLWSPGTMVRTAWLDRGIFPYVLAAADDGHIYRHEEGDDDGDEGMAWMLETGYLDSGDGDARYVLIQGVIPDFQRFSGRAELTIYTKDYPQDQPETHGPFTIRPDSGRIDFRASGKLVAFKLEGSDIGQQMRLGKFRLAVRTGGKRR